MCDTKRVTLSAGANAAADFLLFTEVPIAGHGSVILDDTANEFDPNSPQFGEKFAPPFMPITIRDWTGRDHPRLFRPVRALQLPGAVDSHQQPAAAERHVTQHAHHLHERPSIPDGSADPRHNPQYSTFCYTFQYMPGATTYLDTPVVPVAAFAGPDQFPLDCEFLDGTPSIYSVSAPTNGVGGGPYVPGTAGAADGTEVIEIIAMGDVEVPNPAYCPGPPIANDCTTIDANKTILRDYGFGIDTGAVTVGGVPLTVTEWYPGQIIATVPAGTTTGQLTVTRGDNERSTITGVTFQVGLRSNAQVQTVSPGQKIQDAIGTFAAPNDARRGNDLILVAPGEYDELLIMWKPVQLQGWGEGSTVINAINLPQEKLQLWRDEVALLVDNGFVDLLPGQETGFLGIEPGALNTEEGAGVVVLGSDSGQRRFRIAKNRGARIDGFTITGAATGGGVMINGYADFFEVSNDRVAQ